MSRHKAIHSKKPEFHCGLCNIAAFILKAHRAKYLRNHTDKKSFSFSVGKKQFKSKQDVKNHARYHQDVKDEYTCVFCGKRFKMQRLLDEHILCHLNEKLWDCNLCNKYFVSKSGLKRHVRNIHNKRNLTSHHCCIICEKRFPNKCTLISHIQCHIREKPFSCSKCGKCFSKSYSFQRHIRILHKKFKPHVCAICGKTSGRLADLEDHLRRHLGERFLKCKVCQKTFVTSYELTSHAKKRGHLQEKL